jgi:hypothetical protein
MVLIITQILGGNLGKSNVGFRHLNLQDQLKFFKNSVGWVKERNPTNQMTMVLIRFGEGILFV